MINSGKLRLLLWWLETQACEPTYIMHLLVFYENLKFINDWIIIRKERGVILPAQPQRLLRTGELQVLWSTFQEVWGEGSQQLTHSTQVIDRV